MRLDEPDYPPTSVSKVTPALDAAREQIDRLLASNTFHASDALRRLLRFLAEKTFSGEADDLKEYSVGLDALGKPPTYDPRQDAAVRLQASRLRQKLDDYYRNEGRSDPLVIELPRGRFKIAWHAKGGDSRPEAAVSLQPVFTPQPGEAAPANELRSLKKWRSLAIGLAVTSLVLLFAGVWSLSRGAPTLVLNRSIAGSTPELDGLWSPFLSSAHHLIVAYSNPLFVGFYRKGSPDIAYRTGGNNSWKLM